MSAVGTEFEVEYTVLGAVESGYTDIEAIRDQVLETVAELSADQVEAVDAAIERLETKQILVTDGDVVTVADDAEP